MSIQKDKNKKAIVGFFFGGLSAFILMLDLIYLNINNYPAICFLAWIFNFLKAKRNFMFTITNNRNLFPQYWRKQFYSIL